jgi:hypothetical protein
MEAPANGFSESLFMRKLSSTEDRLDQNSAEIEPAPLIQQIAVGPTRTRLSRTDVLLLTTSP